MNGVIVWVILGLVIGTFFHIILKPSNNIGLWTDIILGISGGIIGGLLLSLFGQSTFSIFYSLCSATIGSIVFIWAGREFFY